MADYGFTPAELETIAQQFETLAGTLPAVPTNKTNRAIKNLSVTIAGLLRTKLREPPHDTYD